MKINIINQDCMGALRGMPDKLFDLAIVDPPFGLGEDGGNRGRGNRPFTTSHVPDTEHARKNRDHAAPGPEYFRELFRVSRHQIIEGANFFMPHLPASQGIVAWDKIRRNDFADFELIWTSFDRSAKIFPFAWNGMFQGKGMAGGIRGDKRKNQKRIHPTQKPVELYEWLLLTFGGTSANILDTHNGSGALAVACLRLGFDLTAYEIDPEYFRLAVGRVREELRQQELFTFRAARQVPGLRPRISERTRDEDRFCLEAEYAPAGQ